MALRRALLIVVATVVLPQALGCRHTTCRAPGDSHSPPFTLDLPVVPKGPLPVAVSLPPNRPEAVPAIEYRRLTAAQCQELAVRNCGPAQRLDREQFDTVNACKKRGDTSDGTARANALGHAADEMRNRAAGDALDLYYKLVASEAGAQVYAAAEGDLTKLLADAKKATDSGLKEPDDVAEVESQLAEVRAETARLEGAVRELNHGLKAMLGLDGESSYRLWPDAPEVRAAAIDVERDVRVGLKYRPDLLLPRSLNASTDSMAPQVALQLLGGVNPLLGPTSSSLPAGSGPVLKLLATLRGIAVPGVKKDGRTRSHVAGLATDREAQAAAEIRAAADRVRALETRSRVYRESAERLRNRVKEMERTEASGRAVGPALAKARAAWRKAEGNLIVAATEHQTAVAKYRQAQGLLVREVMDPAFRVE